MDAVIEFFVETLDGPIYIVVVIVGIILILACIGYLSERALYLKKKESQYAQAKDVSAENTVAEITSTPVTDLKPLVEEESTEENLDNSTASEDIPVRNTIMQEMQENNLIEPIKEPEIAPVEEVTPVPELPANEATNQENTEPGINPIEDVTPIPELPTNETADQENTDVEVDSVDEITQVLDLPFNKSTTQGTTETEVTPVEEVIPVTTDVSPITEPETINEVESNDTVVAIPEIVEDFEMSRDIVPAGNNITITNTPVIDVVDIKNSNTDSIDEL